MGSTRAERLTVEPDPSAALQRLILPHTVADFISNSWEQTHLHVSQQDNPALRDDFARLVSFDDLDLLLTTFFGAGPQLWDALRLSQNGTAIPPEEFQIRRSGPVAEFNVKRILSLFRNGATIVLNAVEQMLSPVAVLCNDLSRFFGVEVAANVYVTPPNGQGFPAHHDNHDVFLLQISGRKDWKLYGSPVPLRMSEHGPEARDRTVAPQEQLRLRAGEVLYLPRGLEHEGAASETTSFHITIGIHPYTWAQLLIDVVSDLQEADVELRRSVAPQLASAGDLRDGLEARAAMLSERLRDQALVGRAVARRVADARSRQRAPLRGRFSRLADPPSVVLTTMLQVAEDEDVALHGDGHEVEVTSREKVITLPGFVEPHLHALFGRQPTCAAALPADLDEAGRLTLVRRLVDEGLLEVVDAPTPGSRGA